MNFALIIIKEPPYQGRKSHEILEAIMSLALFDIEHRVVFFEAGLAWLAESQTPTHQKSLAKQLAALPMYGSESIHYCEPHRNDVHPINEIASPISLAELAQWMHDAKQVEVF